MPKHIPQPQMGEILHRETNQMRHGHRHASSNRRIHGQRASSPPPALRNHHPEPKQTRHRQSSRLHIQRLSNNQHRAQAIRQHRLFPLLNGLRSRRLPPLLKKSTVHILLGDKQTITAPYELALDYNAVFVVFILDRAARSRFGYICERVSVLVLHDYLHSLVNHVLLDTTAENKLLHHIRGGV